VASDIKRTWDTDTAAVVLTLGALGFLFLIRRGFRPVLVTS
jgi:hypothetical protein